MRLPGRLWFWVVIALAGPGAVPWASAARQIVDCDLCIYGATSGGVIAAAQAVRHGLSTALVDAGTHIGGMSSGGLGATDKGNVDSIGGLSSAFYLRVAKKYNPSATTRTWLFEPKVASAVFPEFQSSAGLGGWTAVTNATLTETTESPDGLIRHEVWTLPVDAGRKSLRLAL